MINGMILILKIKLCILVNFPFLDGDVPRSPSYGVYILQPFRFVRVCSNVNHLEVEEKAGCFAFVFLQMYYYYKYSVALPRGAVGWSAVCDCAISWLYSLSFQQQKPILTCLVINTRL